MTEFETKPIQPDFDQSASFHAHSGGYHDRVSNLQDSDLWIKTEDGLIIDFLQQHLPSQEGMTLIDAGCGTGDRLNMIFDEGLDREAFSDVTGIDFAEGMLQYAQEQSRREKPLYTSLAKGDLSQEHIDKKADAVLCLWEVINNNKNAQGMIANLAAMAKDDGVVVFDVATDKAGKFLDSREEAALEKYPSLVPNPHGKWYLRKDNTRGFTWLLPPADLNQYLSEAKLQPMQVWGNYREYGNGAVKSNGNIALNDGHMDVQQASDYPHLLIMARKSPALDVSRQ